MDADTLTKEDFIKSFEKVVSIVEAIRTKNEADMEILAQILENTSKNLTKKTDDSLDQTQQEVMKTLSQLSATLMEKVDQKLSTVKDGKDADELSMVEKVIEGLELPEYHEPDTADEIRNKLEVLQGDDRLDKSAIKGLQEELEAIKTIAETKGGGHGGTAVNSVQYFDCSSQCDGSNKTFRVPNYRYAISLQGTQFPNTYRPFVDFTYGNKTITLTSEVGAPEAGQTLIFIYVK